MASIWERSAAPNGVDKKSGKRIVKFRFKERMKLHDTAHRREGL